MFSGVGKLSDYGPITAAIGHAGLPFPSLGFVIAIAVEIGVGFLLLIGYRAKLDALILALWCVVPPYSSIETLPTKI